MSLQFDAVSFTHEGAATPLFVDIALHCTAGWTGLVGANGSGKTTLLRLALGELSPDRGVVRRSARAAYCPQRTDEASSGVQGFVASQDPIACRLRGAFGVDGSWTERWESLSHGERKRAQVAAALSTAPDVLLLDEPTNHIDEEARRHLLAGLRLFRGTGVLVSHDRDLLDTLCTQCAFLEPPTLVVRPGGYSEAARVHREEGLVRRKARDEASQELDRLRREADRRGREAARGDARRSKRHLARGDRDGRAKIDAARVSGNDARAGALLRQLDGRLSQAERRVNDLAVRKTYDLGLRLPGTASRRNRLIAVPPGVLPLGGTRSLAYPSLAIASTDRIALTGPNGCGKSTLVRHLVAILAEHEPLVYLPQEVSAGDSHVLLERFQALPFDQQGRVLSIVSALGSRPPRLLASLQASPGEIRKLLLALGAVEEPHLIVMDEPTNHLDLPAIECLEEALDRCGAALLVVSHDRRFLERVTRTRWIVTATPTGSRLDVEL